jgi:hypothetical protein
MGIICYARDVAHLPFYVLLISGKMCCWGKRVPRNIAKKEVNAPKTHPFLYALDVKVFNSRSSVRRALKFHPDLDEPTNDDAWGKSFKHILSISNNVSCRRHRHRRRRRRRRLKQSSYNCFVSPPDATSRIFSPLR